MLPSKKSIRKMRTQPFPGWVLSFVRNADNYCGNLIMFSIKIIEQKNISLARESIQTESFCLLSAKRAIF